MDIGGLLLLAVSAALINNFVLKQFLGICPYLGVSRRLDTAFGMGLAVVFVMTVSATVTFLLKKHLLIPYRIEFLEFVVFIFVIASMVQLVEMYLRKFHPPLYEAFGIFLPLITTNCAVLGACLLIWAYEFTALPQVLVFALFAGVGFTIAMVIMGGIREELDLADVPAPLRGVPITLLTAAILGLAFSAFDGIGS